VSHVLSLRPVDLPEARGELVHWYELGLADSFFSSISDDRKLTGIGHLDRVEDGPKTLQEAELFYVEPDMMDLAVHASKSLPDFMLTPEDLPSPSGFLYSPRPFWAPEGGESWVGFAWGLIPGHRTVTSDRFRPGDTQPVRALAVALLGDRESTLDSDPDANAGWIRAHAPRLYEIREVLIWEFDNPMVEDRAVFLDAGLSTSPAMIMKSVWLLMQQKITVTEDVDLDRPARRRLQRQDMPVSGVKLVTLRRQSHKHPEGAPSGREYRHQWIVDSHWRQQWYPSRGVHRPILIMPYVKGPEGAPLIIKDKVNVWKR
jgi:hypothetical protein